MSLRARPAFLLFSLSATNYLGAVLAIVGVIAFVSPADAYSTWQVDDRPRVAKTARDTGQRDSGGQRLRGGLCDCSDATYDNGSYDGAQGLSSQVDPPDWIDSWTIDDIELASSGVLREAHWLTIDDSDFVFAGSAEILILSEAGCTPGSVIAIKRSAANRDGTGEQLFGREVFCYSMANIDVALSAGRYFLGLRPADAVSTGQSFWLTAPLTGCDSWFLAPYFGVIEWTAWREFLGFETNVAFCLRVDGGAAECRCGENPLYQSHEPDGLGLHRAQRTTDYLIVYYAVDDVSFATDVEMTGARFYGAADATFLSQFTGHADVCVLQNTGCAVGPLVHEEWDLQTIGIPTGNQVFGLEVLCWEVSGINHPLKAGEYYIGFRPVGVAPGAGNPVGEHYCLTAPVEHCDVQLMPGLHGLANWRPGAETLGFESGLAFCLSGTPAKEKCCRYNNWRFAVEGGPGPRAYHAHAFDSARGATVLFGGYDGGSSLDDTWEWEGSTWTKVSSGNPPARFGHAMAFDSHRERVVLFGGRLSDGTLNANTWEWDGAQWSLIRRSGPSARFQHAMAYDSSRKRVVLFGGNTGSSDDGETWEFDGDNWARVSTGGPAARERMGMAYDEARGRVVLFGGTNGNPLGDTWEWDGAAWIQVATTGPSPRSEPTLAFDSKCGRIVLFGGYEPTLGLLDDTWVWDGAAWSQITVKAPGARSGHKIAYDNIRFQAVLHGGYNADGVDGETWEFGCPCDDIEVKYDENGNIVLPEDYDPAGGDIEEVDVDVERGLVEDLYPGFDTSTDMWYRGYPCDPAIGEFLPDEADSYDPDKELEELGIDATAEEVHAALTTWDKEMLDKVLDEGDLLLEAAPVTPGYSSLPKPHCIKEGCKYLFGGRDIVFVHGLKLEHVFDRMKNKPEAKVDWAFTNSYPADDENPAFYSPTGYYKRVAEDTWRLHINKWLTSRGYMNRYIVVSYPCNDRYPIGIQAVLTQISDAMNFGTGVVDPSGDHDNDFGTPSFVMVSHSTGSPVGTLALAAAVEYPNLNAKFVADHCKAHIALANAEGGSGFASGAVGLTSAVAPTLACGLFQLIVNELSDGDWSGFSCADWERVVYRSVLVDLSPLVSSLKWGPLMEKTPTRTLTVGGGHPTFLGPLKRIFHPGFDDGVINQTSHCAIPGLPIFWPAGFVPTSRKLVFDLGTFFTYPVRGVGYYLDQMRDRREFDGIAAATGTPFLSPVGMWQSVESGLFGTPFDSTRRRRNYFSYLTSASDHFLGYNGNGLSSSGFNGVYYKNTFPGEHNWEETRILLKDERVFEKYPMLYPGDDGALLNKATVPKMVEIVRGKKICIPTVRKKYECGPSGKKRRFVGWIWMRKYHRLVNWEAKFACDYMYESVLTDRALEHCPPPTQKDDCNDNGIFDICDITNGTSKDCNRNRLPDECDIANGTSSDLNADGVPDECPLCTSPPRNMVLWVSLDEAALNSPGYPMNIVGPDGVYGGTPDVTMGLVQNALYFNGPSSGDYVEVPSYPAIRFGPTNDFSVDAWVRQSDVPEGLQVIVDHRNEAGGETRGYMLFARDGEIGFQLADGLFTDYMSGFSLKMGQWHHVCVTVRRDDEDGLRFFIDGDQFGPAHETKSHNGSLATTSPLRIGCRSSVVANEFYGEIDEVEVFARALADDEVRSLYDALSGGKCKSFCYVPATAGFCRDNGSIVINAQVCNSTASQVTYNYAWLPFNSGTECNVSVLPGDFSPQTGTITVNSGDCKLLSVTIARPAQMTKAGDTACYRLLIQNTTTEKSAACEGKLIDQRDLCVRFNGDMITTVFDQGSIVSAQFVNTTGGPIDGDGLFRILTDEGLLDETSARLNGLPPGTPIYERITLGPGELMDLSFVVDFAIPDPGRFYTILLEADLDGDGVFSPLSSVGLQNSADDRTPTRYVDDNANVGGDGQTWDTAYRYLQDALAEAATDATVTEIRVGQGRYMPDRDERGLVTPGDRKAAFRLKAGLALVGGYRGLAAGEFESPDDYDPAAFPTVMSGDLAGNDGANFENDGENSHHVVMAGSGVNATSTIITWVIEGGNADGSGDPDFTDAGGGLRIADGATPTIRNCVFRLNRGRFGGAVELLRAGGTFENCRFEGNVAFENEGGGVSCNRSNPTFRDCVFADNSAAQVGGGLRNTSATPTLINCRFEDNAAGTSGGGTSNIRSDATYLNCVFSGNRTANNGAAVSNQVSGNVTFINTLMAGNAAGGIGGAIRNDGPTLAVTNCTIIDNRAATGGGLALRTGSASIDNSVVYYNEDSGGMDESAQIDKGSGSFAIDHSDVQGLTGGFGGTGNVGGDPALAANGAWNDNGTPGDPSDDFYVAGDARPAGGSPCIDAADNTALPTDTFDLDGDSNATERLPLDLGGGPRQIDDPATSDTGNGTPPIVDMGAYEAVAEPTQRGDLNCDGSIDFNDIDSFVLALISREDYESQYPDCNYLNGDINGTSSVDFDDIDPFVECLINGGCP